tara:strand:- start:54 stop:890 length:837 start_codon:yes stop_codon:yes gene_type:complete
MSLRIKNLAKRCQDIKSKKSFELLILIVIVASAIAIGVRSYDPGPKLTLYLTIADYCITLIFLIEIIVRMVAEEKFFNFFKSGWNVFDFIIVSVSVIPISGNESILVARLLRIFRVLRLISYMPELTRIVTTVGRAFPKIGYVSLLMFVIFYIYGTIGNIFFDSINPFLWADVSTSMLTLFRVFTLEDWTDVMYETMEVFPYSWIFFLSFIFLVGFVFINIMVAIVLDVYSGKAQQKRLSENMMLDNTKLNVHILQLEQKINDLDEQLKNNKIKEMVD